MQLLDELFLRAYPVSLIRNLAEWTPLDILLAMNYQCVKVAYVQHPRLEFRCAQETVSYTLLPSCKMEVTFATEASTITSITLIGLYDKTVTITSQSQESLQKLYRCLTREISHKGFNEYFKPKKRLGRGNFATVYLVEHRATGQEMAAKVFSREGQNIYIRGKEALYTYIRTLRELDHRSVIKYQGVYETDNLVYLITYYLSGGTLEETMRSRCSLSGEVILRILTDVLEGLSYLDSRNIMHRDIKPDNICRRDDGSWVICDLGLAAHSNEDYLYDRCGTMGYIAPEIMNITLGDSETTYKYEKQLQDYNNSNSNKNSPQSRLKESPKRKHTGERYSQSCDMYSLGVIAYTMIIGYLPFKIESDGLYEKKIVWQLFDRQESYELHPEIICFLKKLLESDPNKRITPRAALESTFFKYPQVVENLIDFHSRRLTERRDRILKMAQIN